MSKKRRRHSAEQFINNLGSAEATLAAGRSVSEVLLLEVSEAPLSRWWPRYVGMKSEEARRLEGTRGKEQPTQQDHCRPSV